MSRTNSKNNSRNASPVPGERESLLKPNQNQNVNKIVVDPAPEEEEKDSSILIAAFAAMIVFQLGNRIFGKLMCYPMYNYALFISVLSTFIYIPATFLYIIPTQLFTDNISLEQTQISKYKFGVMGFFDTTAGIMSQFAVNYISNASLIVLVQQSAIPISMCISSYLLQAKYSTSQYVGAAIVLLGIVVVLAPSFFSPSPSEDGSGGDQSVNTGETIWIVMLVLSCIPMCLSSVYKEKALGEMDIDVIYLNGWVALFQFLFCLPLMFPSAAMINLPMDEIWPNFVAGYRCWGGVNTVVEGNDLGLPPDDCAMAPLYVNLYLILNIVYNLLIVIILKHGSANIMWMASTVIVPMSNFAFSLDIMPHHQPMKVADLVGLFVIMIGLVVYRFTALLQSTWAQLTGRLTKEDIERQRITDKYESKIERKQMRFVGLNQIEALNTLVDSRLVVERNKVLYRSPQTIRGSLLAKLGIPPSPLLTLGPKGRYTDIANMSGPGMERRISESWDKIKNKNPSFIKSSPKTIRNASNNGNNSSNGSRQMSSSYSGATKPMSSDINSYQNEQNDEGVALV